MANQIVSNEFHFQATRNDVSIRTKVPKEFLDDPSIYMRHIRQFKLEAGCRITVQAMSETYDVLYHEAQFLVTSAAESRRNVEDDRGTRLAVTTAYQIERCTDWWSSSVAPVEAPTEPVRAHETYVPDNAEVKWSAGKKAWDVVLNGEVLETVTRIEGETKEEFKSRALAVAAGSEPLTKAA